ncbi:MAG: helix-turn-helix transcriptional regulator [Chloroflexota bacterium]
MSNVATRLISLILLLQSRSNWKAADLAEELNVSQRTVHRYMGMLEEMGIPIYSERGPHGGFSLVRGYRLPPLLFTAEEATVLYMGANLVREVWGQTYDHAVTAVTAKLDNVLPDDLRQEVARARQSLVVGGLTRMDYRHWETAIHALRQSIGERCSVRLLYRGFVRQQETERIVDPYALTLQWGLWYLVGFCHLRQELRTFRVDRIQQIKPTNQSFTIPRDFSVRDYLAHSMSFEPAYTVAVHMEASVAPEVRERYGHWMDIVDHDDGAITVRFSTASLDWATGWALMYGPAARALEPAELAQRVRAAAAAVLSRYEG